MAEASPNCPSDPSPSLRIPDRKSTGLDSIRIHKYEVGRGYTGLVTKSSKKTLPITCATRLASSSVNVIGGLILMTL